MSDFTTVIVPVAAMAIEDSTDFILDQFIGGWAFFEGVILCLLGSSLKFFFSKNKLRSIARVMTLAGAVFVALSAAPFPFWVYAIFFALLALASFPPTKVQPLNKKTDYILFLLLFAQSMVMVCNEIQHSLSPKIPFEARDTLYVIGDSLSMGADPPGKNWPELLGDYTKLKVRNQSFGGAKIASSLDQTMFINQDAALVILEIGGNDLLGGTSIPQFRKDLDKMLTLVSVSNRCVAMIELPLPPFYNRFGMVQRDLAKSHGVKLIPKRYLAQTICTSGATVDGIHLSNAGHVLFARKLSEILIRKNEKNSFQR